MEHNTGTAKTTAPHNIDLTDLSLEILVELPLSEGGAPLEDAVREAAERALARAADDPGSVDLTSLGLDQLLALSVGGKKAEKEEPEEPEETGETVEVVDNAAEGEGEAPPARDRDARDGGPVQEPPAGGGSHFSPQDLDLSALALAAETGARSLRSGIPIHAAGSKQAGSGPFRPDIFSSSPALEMASDDDPAPPVQRAPASGDPPGERLSTTDVGLAGGTVREVWSAGDRVARIEVADPDAPRDALDVTFTLVDDADGRFELDEDSGVVRIAADALFDFASAGEHPIIVRVISGGETVDQTFTIHVSPDDRDADGQPGEQVLTGATGESEDRLFGGPGDDRISGLDGGDTLYGGSGEDRLFGGNHDDRLYGGSGADALFGDNHDDFLHGGTGTDLLLGGAHEDVLHGGGGDDALYGGGHDDDLHGEGGADWLDGGPGRDRLLGGTGDDRLIWDAADTLIDGGDGDDRLVLSSGEADLAAFAGSLRGIESVDLAEASDGNLLTLTAADVLDMTDVGPLAVLGDGKDRVAARPGWTLDSVDDEGRHLYVQSVGDDLAGLLLDPAVQFATPADGGGP